MALEVPILLKKLANKLKKILQYFKNNDFRDNPKLLRYGVFLLLLLVGTYMRYRLIPGINGDYTIYISHWYDHLHTFGFSGFKDNFANYNFPYLFFLYISTLLPIPKLVAVKMISILFDFVLVAAVYQLVKILAKSKTRAMMASAVVFFLPTVLINSAYWGQTDAIYTSFLLFTVVALLKGHFRTMWILFGVAIAFKLQAIFILPVLFYVWYLKRGVWWGPFLSVITFIGLSIGPVLAGRSVTSSLSVYFNQYGFEPLLSASVPNFYYWLPQQYYDVINGAGVLFALGITVLVTYAAVAKMKFSKYNILFFALLCAVLIPSILPQMHDRYFFLFEVLLIVMSFVSIKFIPLAIVMQIVTLIVYTKTLFGYKEVPFGFLVAAVTTLLVILLYGFAKYQLRLRNNDVDTLEAS